jgi:hypothetical protein
MSDRQMKGPSPSFITSSKQQSLSREDCQTSAPYSLCSFLKLVKFDWIKIPDMLWG